MGWAAIGKAVGGAVKGGAKKIATNKLLGRGKKKPQKPQAEGGEQEKGGALAIRPTTSLVPAGPSAIVPVGGDLGKAGKGGGGGGVKETLIRVQTKIVTVESLMRSSHLMRKRQLSDQHKTDEKAENKAEEKALEKVKQPKEGKKLKMPGQVKSLLGKVFGFFTTMMFGWLAIRLVPLLPKLLPVMKALGWIVDRFIDALLLVVQGLAIVIDFGYKLVDALGGWVKNTFGEEGAKKFETFMGNLKDLIGGFLVWKIIGKKIFDSIVANIRSVWRAVTGGIRKAWVMIRRMVGRHVRQFFGNLVKRTGGILKGAGRGILNVGKGLLSKAGGLLSKGGGALAKTGGAKVVAKVGGWAAKMFGKAASIIAPALKAATPAIKGFAGRIPILGPLIVALVSLMSGEPVGQALFKGIGAALGGALGTFIPIPFVGTLLGEAFGAFVGDLLYYIIIKRDPKKAFEVLKQTLMGIFKAGEFVFNFFKDGIGRFIENFPTIPIPDFRPGDIIAKMMMNFPGGLDILGLEVPSWIPFIGGASVIGFLQGIPGLQEVLGFFAQFIPGMGRYVENGKLLAIPNLLMLSPLGLPFLTPLLAKSFLPGLFGDPSPPQLAAPGKAPEKISAASIRAESERKKKEAHEKRMAALKAKLNQMKDAVTGAIGNIWSGVTGIFGGGKKKDEKPSATIDDSGGKTELIPMLRGGLVPFTFPALLHKGEIVIDPDSSGPAKDMLLAINEASTYEGIVEAIRKFAPYEALEPSAIIVSPPPTPSSNTTPEGGGEPMRVPVPVGSGHDPFEIFYMGS